MLKPSLRTQIFILLAALIAISFLGGVATLWNTQQSNARFSFIINEDIHALQAAQELQTALIMQKGLATYYSLQEDKQWLKDLRQYQELFTVALKKARKHTLLPQAHEILFDLESKYLHYAYDRDQIIFLYKQGKYKEGADKHWEVRKEFLSLVDLCMRFKFILQNRMNSELEIIQKQQNILFSFSIALLIGSFIISLALSYILFKKILIPIRKLVSETLSYHSLDGLDNEVSSLILRVKELITSVRKTKSELKESKEHLQQTEKMATTGKLAASMAHSIRNPLTSVKMRLFSLHRSLHLSKLQKEDFEVISEEIRHIDNILGNFLEFSRRPKLKIQSVDPWEVVQLAVQLMRYRLEGYGMEVILLKEDDLPEVMLDTDQIKEVLVNLMENSCEAMAEGGQINIKVEKGIVSPLGKVIVIRYTDNGPGIAFELQQEIFTPFFTTKEEGTGLGLSIARRIIEDHGGWINVSSRPGEGTTFSITIPVRGAESEQDINS